MIIISPYIPHHDVDEGVLYEGEEDKEGAGGHEHVNRLVANKININNKRSLAESKTFEHSFSNIGRMEGGNSFSELGRSLVRLVSP